GLTYVRTLSYFFRYQRAERFRPTLQLLLCEVRLLLDDAPPNVIIGRIAIVLLASQITPTDAGYAIAIPIFPGSCARAVPQIITAIVTKLDRRATRIIRDLLRATYERPPRGVSATVRCQRESEG